MRFVSPLAVLLLTFNAFAGEDEPRNHIRVDGSCELLISSESGIKVSAGIFRGHRTESVSSRISNDIKLDSASNGATLLGGSFNREQVDFLFSLVPHGTFHQSGGDEDQNKGSAYALIINPVFDPNNLWRSMRGDSAQLAEDAISAGRLRGQTNAWVKIYAYDDGRIEASTMVGHLNVTRLESKDGELEFTMPMQFVDPSRGPRAQRVLGKVLSATRLGEAIDTSTVELKVKLKMTASQTAPLQIARATVEPIVSEFTGVKDPVLK